MSAPPLLSARRRIWPLIKKLFLALVLIFIARRAYQLWSSAPPEVIQIHFVWLLPAGLAYAIGWMPSVWLWRALLRDMNQPVGFWQATQAYYIGHVGKYVPGKALVLVIRGSLLKEAGVNPILGGLTAAYETLVFMATGAALALALSPKAFGEAFWSSVPEWIRSFREPSTLLPILIVIITFATTPISSWLFTKLGRKTFDARGMDDQVSPAISARLVSLGVVACSVGWVFHSLSLGLVLRSLSDGPIDLSQFPIWMAATTLSTVGGFVVLLAPGGIGVREGLLIEALKDHAQIGPTIALVAAALLRAVWFTTELIAAGFFYLLRKRTSLETPPEQ